jgi:predicted O-methyltransferase YrrM
MAAHSHDERERLMHSKTEYLDFYGRLKDLWLPVSRETGALLCMLARSSGARSIIKFGTSFGISTLHLAAALRDNGGGRLITSEFEPSKISRARQNLADGGLIDLVEIREGDALKTLSSDLPETIDLLLLDGAGQDQTLAAGDRGLEIDHGLNRRLIGASTRGELQR